MCISLSAMALLSCGTAATCSCQLGLHRRCRELGLEQYCGLKSVILLSHFLFFYLWVRSCSGTIDQDTANQVKDFLARKSASVEEDSRRCPGQLKTDVGRVLDQQREEEFTQSV